MSRWQQVFLALARPASQAYGTALRIRAQAYRRGLLRSWRPPVPCISVGNIRLGGTGKTPMVAWLLTWAQPLPVLFFAAGVAGDIVATPMGRRPEAQRSTALVVWTPDRATR